ncbi:unnamed protein product [Schistosoma margrebowiei]|uniref:Uncharacterized protein n=1 Tax=Schistosoma margrebowiei TaxID=48269 RepID=A0A3P8DGM0_9TREM|nr:unnamed protein product [Schistosoma margrebowiei]
MICFYNCFRYGPNNSCLLSNGLDSVEKSHSSCDSLFKSQRDYERHLVGFHLLKHPVYKRPDVRSPLPIPPISSHYNGKFVSSTVNVISGFFIYSFFVLFSKDDYIFKTTPSGLQ